MGEEEEMSDGELRGKVLVGGRSYEISVYRKSKSVWIAVGDYMGVTITVQDRSEDAALKRWREAAEHKGNWAQRAELEYGSTWPAAKLWLKPKNRRWVALVGPLLLRHARKRKSETWGPDDYNVIQDGRDIGRIFKSARWRSRGSPLDVDNHGSDRRAGLQPHGFCATLDEAMAKFAEARRAWLASRRI
jgi:hypothetical protein